MDSIARHASAEKKSCAVHFYSAWYCPYAQRAWIALNFKRVDFHWIETALYEGTPSSKRSLTIEEKESRTPGFTRFSPRGLIPALSHNGEGICDSLSLIEYVEEAFESYNLYPLHDLVERARIRTGISLFNELVIRRFYTLLMSPSDASSASFLGGLEEIASYFTPTEQTQGFFSSHGFSMFEVACLPWYQRTLSVLKEYRNFSPSSPPCARLALWYEACLKVPAFSCTLVDEGELVANYSGYANDTADNNCSSLNKKGP